MHAKGNRARRAALPVAAPVSGEAIHLTNSHWSFARRALPSGSKRCTSSPISRCSPPAL